MLLVLPISTVAQVHPPTVLSKENECRLSEYCVIMADMGFGLIREAIIVMAHAIVDKTGREHSFKSGLAKRGWYEGFMSQQAILTLRAPQSLSYARAMCVNRDPKLMTSF